MLVNSITSHAQVYIGGLCKRVQPVINTVILTKVMVDCSTLYVFLLQLRDKTSKSTSTNGNIPVHNRDIVSVVLRIFNCNRSQVYLQQTLLLTVQSSVLHLVQPKPVEMLYLQNNIFIFAQYQRKSSFRHFNHVLYPI